jgi:hypothetical protein
MFGRTALTEFEQRVTVKRAVVHPDYKPATSNKNDIAVLRLAGQFECGQRRLFPACLPRRKHYADWRKVPRLVVRVGVVRVAENYLKHVAK